jgi:tetratricopeptide repeat protein
MKCDRVSAEGIAEKYLLGQLNEADQEVYERHFFDCPDCFQELQIYRTTQAELKRVGLAIRNEPARQRVLWHWSWAAAAAAAVLVVILGMWGRVRLHTAAPGPPAASIEQQERVSATALNELTAIQPPPYIPVTVRGSADEATQKFELAMLRYRRGNYRACIPLLRTAVELDPDAVDAQFFLGISYLLTGQNDQAINELRQTAARGDTPYLEQTHFYLAKAYLGKNDLTAAEAELKKIVGFQSSYGSDARKLLDQLQELRSVRR